MKNWLIALTLITFFLAFMGFSNSFLMNSEIEKIQNTDIAVDRLNKDILYDIAFANIGFLRDKADQEKNEYSGIERLNDAAEKAGKVLNMAQNEDERERAKKIVELIGKNIKIPETLKTGNGDEVKFIKLAKERASLEKEIFSEISESTAVTQKTTDERISNINKISSKFILISMFLLVFVTGGIALTAIASGITAKNRDRELDFYVSNNLMDKDFELYNKTYFLTRLKEFLNEAARFKQEVAVVRINVELETNKENIKIASIRAAGKIIQKGTRNYNIVTRYDNAITVLMNRAGRKEADILMARIKKQLGNNELPVEYKKRGLFFLKQKRAVERVKIAVNFDLMIYPADKTKIEAL